MLLEDRYVKVVYTGENLSISLLEYHLPTSKIIIFTIPYNFPINFYLTYGMAFPSNLFIDYFKLQEIVE